MGDYLPRYICVLHTGKKDISQDPPSWTFCRVLDKQRVQRYVLVHFVHYTVRKRRRTLCAMTQVL